MIARKWATPLVSIGLILMALTGLGMFFELGTELTKEVHEWGGWFFVAGVILHIASNLEGFKRHFAQPMVKAVMMLSLLVATGTFFVGDRGEEHEGEHGEPEHSAQVEHD